MRVRLALEGREELPEAREEPAVPADDRGRRVQERRRDAVPARSRKLLSEEGEQDEGGEEAGLLRVACGEQVADRTSRPLWGGQLTEKVSERAGH